MRALDKLRAQLRERHACGAGGIGEQRRFRHAGDGVRLQNPARSIVFQNEVGTGGAAARKGLMSLNRLLAHARGNILR